MGLIAMSSRKLIATAGLLLALSSLPARAEHVLPPMQHTFFCLKYPLECKSQTDAKAPALSKAQRVRELQQVNATINQAISSVQLQPSPLKQWTIFPRMGDCGDYAVTKRHVLLSRGWPSSHLLLAEVVLRRTGVHHLVLIAKNENENVVLDNLRSEVLPLKDIFRDYFLIRIEASDNPEFWIRPSGRGLS
jgi:predicted transglutaminase-like cysteine proteinase